MPVTDVDICNLGLGIIGASQISSLAQPQKANEIRCARVYPQVRDTELRKHRWLCAKRHQIMTGADPSKVHRSLRFAYSLPTDPWCLRVIRDQVSDWSVEGRYLYTDMTAGFWMSFIGRVPEADFDPLLVDVIAARLAFLLAEPVTQSNTKKADALDIYSKARADAKRANAFETGPEFPPADTWVTARF